MAETGNQHEKKRFEMSEFLELIRTQPPARQRELVNAKIDEIGYELSQVNTQLDLAKAELMARGTYADPIWFANALGAHRIKSRQLQQLHRILGTLPRSLRQHQKPSHPLAPYFMEAAKKLLTNQQFHEIVQQAMQDRRDLEGQTVDQQPSGETTS